MNQVGDSAQPRTQRRAAWLSKGFEVLAHEVSQTRSPANSLKAIDFEVIVIGSGYGGAIAAAELATVFRDSEHGPRGVCVLERGREYLQGAFPTRLAELPRHIRYTSDGTKPRGERTALLDFRLGPDMSALVANGLGGGSLINAGVMEKPLPEVFGDKWPAALRGNALDAWWSKASTCVGARRNGLPHEWTDERLPKVAAMKQLHTRARPVALTIAAEKRPSAANVELEACVRCGDCMTGCNHGAKESLDTNLLVQARERGAHIFSGATALRIERTTIANEEAWAVSVSHTDEKLRRRQEAPLQLFARKLVLAAGTLGSTELLLRSRSDQLRFSTRLGKGFSGNGDMLASLVDLKIEPNAVADEAHAPNARNVGPTITRMIDERDRKGTDADVNARVVIQDLTVPGALRALFEEASAVAKTFDTLTTGDDSEQAADRDDPCAVFEAATKRALIVALIGHDSADGTIALNGDPPWKDDADGDGATSIHFPPAPLDLRLDARHERLDQLRERAKLGGRALANPLWRVLPPELGFLFGNERGPLLTVHPLGGCGMGENADSGVVDDIGRVYNAAKPKEFHAGLVVLDGSVIPTSLGINPALTITAIALRAIKGLLVEWKRQPGAVAADAPKLRPIFRRIDASEGLTPQPTLVEAVERMSGEVLVPGYPQPLIAELTLQFKPKEIRALMDPRANVRQLSVNPERSRLRLFTEQDWEEVQRRPDDDPPDEAALWIARVSSGTFTLFRTKPSSASLRRARAFLPWLCNRGARDLYQELVDAVHARVERLRPGRPASSGVTAAKERIGAHKAWLLGNLAARVRSLWALLSLAGEVRLFEYSLNLEAPTKAPDTLRYFQWHRELVAKKEFTYNHRANPWNQLLKAAFTSAPFYSLKGGTATLDLDLRFLERRATPVFRVLKQEDQVTTTVDVVRFGLYFLRILLRVHTWSLRQPDRAKLKPIDRLPRLRDTVHETFEVDTTNESAYLSDALPNECKILLTRFPPQRAGHNRPVLMVHGYSVSGTTFAHPSAPSLAEFLAKHGYDAWIVDLRTSAALQTAKLPWSFEEVAYGDIPAAVEFIVSKTGFDKIDIVAHCMGSAMVCMALLEDDLPQPYRDWVPVADPVGNKRILLKNRIRRMVLSQVAPVTLFTPVNVLRAFVLRYVRHYLNLDEFQFRVEGPPNLRDQLLDRFLATLPYPSEEFDRENPPAWQFWKRTPWTSTRHRMDALYGRDFTLRNVTDETLEHIDDFFGPLNIDTVSQAIHFARFRSLTDKTGYNRYVTGKRVTEQLAMPILSIHGEENGLVDVKTRNYLRDLWSDAGLKKTRDHLSVVIEGHGHQDSFIGKHAAREVFPKILHFLEREKFQ